MQSTSIRNILAEIKEIRTGVFSSSMQTARNFFPSGALPRLLAHFLFRERMLNETQAARLLGISHGSLKRILSGEDVSENMLLRIETFFEKEQLSEFVSNEKSVELYRRPWRLASDERTQELISRVSQSLLVLVQELRASNIVGNPSSPISEIQRAQLIATLEATLIALKAPAIDAKQTASVFSWVRNIFKRGAEKGLEKGISEAMSDAYGGGLELIESLAEQQGFDFLDKIS